MIDALSFVENTEVWKWRIWTLNINCYPLGCNVHVWLVNYRRNLDTDLAQHADVKVNVLTDLALLAEL
jgi:hypothetical protein